MRKVSGSERNVGFGHTMLRTTFESEHEHQPFSLDGQVWITADARIDDRENLVKELKSKGQEVVFALRMPSSSCTHTTHGVKSAWSICSVILHSRSGTDGLGASSGARDHMGVRPFYYFQSGKTFVFSNTLNSVRRHPHVSDRLSDQAVADFLAFRHQPGTTPRPSIPTSGPVAPAHSLVISKDRCVSHRYWTMPIDEPVYYKRSSDYVDRFIELLTLSIRDRTRAPWIGVFMSGGFGLVLIGGGRVQILESSAGGRVLYQRYSTNPIQTTSATMRAWSPNASEFGFTTD